MDASDENYRIVVTPWQVTHEVLTTANGTTAAAATVNSRDSVPSPSNMFIIKAKIKSYLYLVVSQPTTEPPPSSTSSSSNNVNNSNVINKFRISKYSNSYNFPRQIITSDDGGPTSHSWTHISNMISLMSAGLPFRLDRLHWQLPGEPNPTPLTSRDELVRRVLQEARTVASKCASQLRRFSLHLCIKREVFSDHTRFVTRVQDIFQGCLSRLRPPLVSETVKSEITAGFRAGGLLGYITSDTINQLTQKILLRRFEHNSGVMMTPASEDAINGLESFIFVGDDDDSGEQLCVVCSGKILATVVATRLPCSHIYHADCANEWLRRSHMCPLCRYPLPTQ